MKRALCGLMVLVAFLGESRAGWGSGGCSLSVPVGMNVFQTPVAPVLFTGWEPSAQYPPWQFYWKAGKIAEAWHPETKERLIYRDQAWITLAAAKTADQAKKKAPPVEVKEEAGPVPGYNGGIVVEELEKDRPQYRVNVNGTETTITKKEAIGLVTSPDSDKVPNDKDKPWLIAVGDQDFLKRFSADLDKAAIKVKVRYQGYSADSFVVKKFNLDDSPAYQRSKTAVILSLADGTVVHGQFDYKAGDLDVVGQKFDPTRLPDLRVPERVGEGAVDQLFKKIKEEPVVWVGGFILLILLLMKDNK